MKSLKIIILFILVTIYGCKKDAGRESAPFPIIVTSENFTCEDTMLNWEKLPPDPPTGYNYYTEKANETVWRVLYDPHDRNVIYYTTNEGNNFHHLWKYNRLYGTKVFLDNNVLINLSISKNGWLAYEKQDKNIYIIKTNGDSLTKLTSKGTYLFPSWSEDGKNVFYWDDSNPTGIIFKANRKGIIIDTLKQIYSGVFQIKNFVYYLKFSNNVFYLVQRNLDNNIEKDIVTRAVGNTLGENIMDFYTNDDNTILYWCGDHGLSKTDLTTLQTTRIINGGNGSQNPTWNYKRSRINGRFIAVQYNQTFIDSFTIRATNKILEFKEDGSCRRTVKIPD